MAVLTVLLLLCLETLSAYAAPEGTAPAVTLPFYHSRSGAASTSLDVSDIQLSLQGRSTVSLSLRFALSGTRLPKGYIAEFVPRIYTDRDSLDLPAVRFMGSRAYRHEQRSPYAPEADVMEYRDRDAFEPQPYAQTVSYHEWMDRARVKFVVSTADGCGDLQGYAERDAALGYSLPAAPAPSIPMLFNPAPVDTSAYRNYPYVRFINKGDSIKLSDEQFYDLAGKVIFPINKYNLPKKDSLIMQLENEVFPLIKRDSLELAYMMLRGAASPEGPTRWNKFLGEKRAEAILNFIKENIQLPEDFDMGIDIEDYRTLCLMMRRMGDKDYGYVQAMCDQYLPKNLPKLKATLRAARQGTLWLRLFREYFPHLRAVRVVFFFYAPQTYKQPEVIAPVAEVEPRPVEKPAVVNVQDQTPPAALPKVQMAWEERVPRRELLSVKTNLLFYGVYMPSGYDRWCPIPNVALEYYPMKGHFTYGASMDFPWWQNYRQHKYFQVRNYQLEARYYLRSGSIEKNRPGQGAAFRGLYFQAYAHAAVFGICFDADRGWEGEGFGGGLGVGYVLPLSRKGHWRLEFNLQAGFFGGKYDPYQYEFVNVPGWEGYPHDDLYYYKYYGDPERFKKRQHSFSWFGPTRVGITLAYDLLYRRIQKKGVSFRPWEDKTIISNDQNENE